MCTIKLKAMKTTLTKWQHTRIAAIIRSVFFTPSCYFFNSRVDNVKFEDILQLNDVTPEQVVDSQMALIATLYEEDYQLKVAIMNIISDEGDVVRLGYAVVNQSKHMYASIVFLQGSEANEPLDILRKEGKEAAMAYMKQWDYGEYHILTEESSAGTDDDLFEKDEYLLSYNQPLGYISLEKIV